MTATARFSSRIMRRRGRVDGRAIAQETLDRFVPLPFTPETEQELEVFARNKIARATEGVKDEGAPHSSLQQYVLACTAGWIERINEWRDSLKTSEGKERVH